MAYKTILTTYGNNQILSAMASGTQVAIASMVFGDGGGSSYTPTVGQTTLVRQVLSINNITKRFDETDGFIYFTATIPANSVSFVVREIGLLDVSGGLIAVGTVPDTSKPAAEDGLEVSLPVSLGFKTSIGDIMIVYVDQGDAFADKTWVIQQISDIDVIQGRMW